METELVILEESFIQLDAYHAHPYISFFLWGTVLGTRKENVNIFFFFHFFFHPFCLLCSFQSFETFNFCSFVLFFSNHLRMDQQNLFNVFGSMYISVIFLGINNCTTVLQHVATERTVMYREKFAGMYSPWAYSLAQVQFI